jgi:hypothetical protein
MAAVAVASPALAFSTQQIQAPHNSAHEFGGRSGIAHMMPGSASTPMHEPAKPTEAKTVIYTIPAGKPAAEININDPKNNPFLAR